jgi:hypothetical protein
MQRAAPSDPTTLTPVGAHKLALLRELAQELPDASREELVAVQQQRQPAPKDATIAASQSVSVAPSGAGGPGVPDHPPGAPDTHAPLPPP